MLSNYNKSKNTTNFMNERFFSSYSPKNTKDTIFDYNFKVKEIIEGLNLPKKPTIIDLEKLTNRLEEYIEKSKLHPGNIQRGNIILGADEEEYVPSEEELIQSYIGELIIKRLNNLKDEEFNKLIKLQKKRIKFRYIEIYHMDVMGSGRFFYARCPIEKTIKFQ
jgi:hypothetical protein